MKAKNINLFFILPLFVLATKITAAPVIVSGANSGIGQAITQKLNSESNSIILVARNADSLHKTQLRYKELGTDIPVYSFDYAKVPDIQKTFTKIAQKHNKISGLVVLTPRPQLDDSLLPSAESWNQMFQQCFIGPLEMLKQSIPLLKDGGSIVIVSGITSKEVLPKHASFGILRSMWLAEAKGLSHQLGEKSIRVNSVSPGGVLTDGFITKLNKRASNNQLSYSQQLADETQNIPLKKYAQPEDVANAVAFLLSDKSGHISGANITIDGGFTKAY